MPSKKELASHIDASYKRLFNSQDGRNVLFHLMRQCFYFDSTFVANDAIGTAYNEGMRNTLLNILRVIKMKPETIDKMVDESRAQLERYTDDY